MIPSYVINSPYTRYETYDTELIYREGQIENYNRIIHDLESIYHDGKFVGKSNIYTNWTYAANINMFRTDWGVLDLDWHDIDKLNLNDRRTEIDRQVEIIMKVLNSIPFVERVDSIVSSFLYHDTWVGIPKIHVYFKLNGTYDISPIYRNPSVVKSVCSGFIRWAHSRGGVTVRISKKFGNKKLYMKHNKFRVSLHKYDNDDKFISMKTIDLEDGTHTRDEQDIAIKKTGHGYMDNENKNWTGHGLTSSHVNINLCTQPLRLRTFKRENGTLVLSNSNVREYLSGTLIPKQSIIYDEGICLR